MYPWLWFWAPQFHFPFSGSVAQRIEPDTRWFFDGIPARGRQWRRGKADLRRRLLRPAARLDHGGAAVPGEQWHHCARAGGAIPGRLKKVYGEDRSRETPQQATSSPARPSRCWKSCRRATRPNWPGCWPVFRSRTACSRISRPPSADVPDPQPRPHRAAGARRRRPCCGSTSTWSAVRWNSRSRAGPVPVAGRAVADRPGPGGRQARPMGGAAPGEEGLNLDHFCLCIEPFEPER